MREERLARSLPRMQSSTHTQNPNIGRDLEGHQVHPTTPSHLAAIPPAICPPHVHPTSDEKLATFQESPFHSRSQQCDSFIYSSNILNTSCVLGIVPETGHIDLKDPVLM